MAQAATATRQELELTRESLAANADRLVAKARAELDWKARLRRDLPQILAVAGGVVVLGVTAALLRRRFKPRHEGLVVHSYDQLSVDDLTKELRAMRKEIEKAREGGGGPALKLATTAVTAAATAAGRVVAGRLVEQPEEEPARA